MTASTNDLTTSALTSGALTTGALTIGIDVGGTKIAAGLVDGKTGALVARREIPTAAERGGQAVLDDVVAMARALLQETQTQAMQVNGIGLGICELVDPAGAVQSAQTVAWQGLPVQATLQQLLAEEAQFAVRESAGIGHAVVESDVRAHALAEACFGAGRDYALFAFITIGTGISSCIVQARTPLAGARGNALVLATSPLEIPLQAISQGDSTQDAGNETQPIVFQSFVVEEFASGLALLQRYRAATGEELAHGRELFARAEQGDPIAVNILESAGAALGNSIAFLVNIVDPDALVIGGGLGMAGGIYWESMEAAIRRAIYADTTRTLPIRQAQLGADAGIIGAALAAYRRRAGVPPRANTPETGSVHGG